jgi:ketosteroid isomerase-like protein
MRCVSLWSVTLAILTASSAVAQNAPVTSPSNSDASSADLHAIQQIEADWLKGEETTDVAVFDRVLADDYVDLTPRGMGPGKAEITRHMQPHAGQAQPYTVATADLHIYILGDTAVAAYVETYTAKENGKVQHEDNTHIFRKDHGVWKLKISRESACDIDYD